MLALLALVPARTDAFLRASSLDERPAGTGKPLLVLMRAEEQVVEDPRRALERYARGVPAAGTRLLAGAGHSPNVERPGPSADLVLKFANDPAEGVGSEAQGASERGKVPQRSSEIASSNRASGVRSATGGQ